MALLVKDCAKWKQFSTFKDWHRGPSLVQVHIVQGLTLLASPKKGEKKRKNHSLCTEIFDYKSWFLQSFFFASEKKFKSIFHVNVPEYMHGNFLHFLLFAKNIFIFPAKKKLQSIFCFLFLPKRIPCVQSRVKHIFIWVFLHNHCVQN